MSRRGKQLTAEREWRSMTPQQRQPREYQPRKRSRFTLHHFVLITAALLVVAVVDYFFPALRGMLQ